MKAFLAGDYPGAIVHWRNVDSSAQPSVSTALAEAHFRIALASSTTASDRTEHLETAVSLCPNDPRYQYHLGLAQHHLGNLPAALKAYDAAADWAARRPSAAFTVGIANIEAGRTSDAEALPGLSDQDRAIAAFAVALLQRQPDALRALIAAHPISAKATSWTPLLRLCVGIAFLLCGEAGKAREVLSAAPGALSLPAVDAARSYFLAIALIQTNDPSAAGAVLSKAARSNAQSFFEYRVVESAHSFLIPQIETLLEQGKIDEAERLSRPLGEGLADKNIGHVVLRVLHARFDSHRSRQNWEGMVKALLGCERILSEFPELGSLEPVTRNLAICYEQLGDDQKAAEYWEELLRQMPRSSGRASKSAAAQAAAAALQQRRNWIRRRLIEAFKRAGLPELAIEYYKQAIKACPEDLALRLDLVRALIENDQTTAAMNEVGRILERDENNGDALLLGVELKEQKYDREGTLSWLRRIAASTSQDDKKFAPARNKLTGILLEQAMEEVRFTYRHPAAHALLDEILMVDPKHADALLMRARLYRASKKLDLANEQLNRLRELQLVETYIAMLLYHSDYNDAATILALVQEIKALPTEAWLSLVSAGGYLAAVNHSDNTYGHPTADVSSLMALGRQLVQEGMNVAKERGELYLGYMILIDRTVVLSITLTKEYAAAFVEAMPQDFRPYFVHAFVFGLAREKKAALKSLSTVQTLTRRLNRPEIVERIEKLRFLIESNLFSMLPAPDRFLSDLMYGL